MHRSRESTGRRTRSSRVGASLFPGSRHLLPQRPGDTRVAFGLIQGLAHGTRYSVNHFDGLGDTTDAAAEIHQFFGCRIGFRLVFTREQLERKCPVFEIRAVELCIKLGKRIRAAIRQLG